MDKLQWFETLGTISFLSFIITMKMPFVVIIIRFVIVNIFISVLKLECWPSDSKNKWIQYLSWTYPLGSRRVVNSSWKKVLPNVCLIKKNSIIMPKVAEKAKFEKEEYFSPKKLQWLLPDNRLGKTLQSRI